MRNEIPEVKVKVKELGRTEEGERKANQIGNRKRKTRGESCETEENPRKVFTDASQSQALPACSFFSFQFYSF